MTAVLAWPPSYVIRYSKRAKSINLRISPVKGLEIVLPYDTPQTMAQRFLEQHRSWVEKHVAMLQPEVIAYEARRYELPSEIVLPLLNMRWNCQFDCLSRAKLRIHEVGQSLRFVGRFVDFKACLPATRQWLRNKAIEVLPKMLQCLSEQTQLTYKRVTIRNQKTLWGSCSRDGNISINQKLLFLTPEQANYIMLHELCHTRHFNHSKRFWHLVEKFEPRYKIIDKALRRIDEYLPKWYCDV